MERHRIGMVVPSANTCLEPVTSRILGGVPDVSVHFSRIQVRRVGLDEEAQKQFELPQFVRAAELLADADVQLIAWNGSSGSWRGVGGEDSLLEAITEATGRKVTTTTLAIFEAFRELGVKRYSLVVPFTDDIKDGIVATYAEAGFECVRAVNLPLITTLEKDSVEPELIRDLVRAAAQSGPDAVAVVCTNFRAAPLVAELESELGLPIVDSVAVTAWHCLRLLGIGHRIQGWGRLLEGAAPQVSR